MEVSESSYVPVADQVGTVWKVVSGAGSAANSYQYDAFGVSRSVSESFTNPFRFAGKHLDADPALYHFVARAYCPRVGRFAGRETALLVLLAAPDLTVLSHGERLRSRAAIPPQHGDGVPRAPVFVAGAAVRESGNADLYTYARSLPLGVVDPDGLHATGSWWHNYYHEIGWFHPTHHGKTEPYKGSAYEWIFIDDPNMSLFCGFVRLAASRNMTQCLCGITGIGDLVLGKWAGPVGLTVEMADCVCNILTFGDLLCGQGPRNPATIGYGLITGADCFSMETGKLLKTAADILSPAPGPLAPWEDPLYEVVADILAWLAENRMTQGKWLPEAQYRACCEVVKGRI